ncbi:hypothetical protein B0T20DRAFT_441510 [Sordaria brevicollis]|uniref:Apopolysialoglycoprotein n=1 Tax=Sordaria brevicollis TaxID=83679 RepID=A0AAE0U9N0_SORBR|nr:hypothetical protein B0T20DRAFT_441510 [Sordaria brevicollis]
MAPTYHRSAAQTRRGARSGFPEHDDFEGLPVRQWRQEWVNVTPPQPAEATQKNDIWDVELPFGMPKETKLLPTHSQELLRAARSGRLYKRPAPTDDDDENADIDIKGDKKESDAAAEGFTVKMWKQTPRNVEVPAESHLAKRHKNTVTLPPKSTLVQIAQGPTVTRATVRRIDAAGNPYEQTITLAEGQQVDGEIISTTVVPAPAAAAEVAAQAAPPAPVRRRPPPPKRKAKGPGRGRKKGKLPLPTTTRPEPSTAEAGGNTVVKVEVTPVNGIKTEDTGEGANQDSEIADSSQIPSDDDDGDDGDDGEEEGDADESMAEGDTPVGDASTNQDQDQEMPDAGASDVIRPSLIEEPDEKGASNEEDAAARSRLGSSLAPPTLGSLASRLEGSPLKNVMIRSPTEPPESRSEMPGIGGSFFPSTDVDLVKTEVTSAAKEVGTEDNSASAVLVSETTVEAAPPVAEAANDTTAMDIDTSVEQQQQQPKESTPSVEANVEDAGAARELPALRPDASTSVFTPTTSTTAEATKSETTIAATETTSTLAKSPSLPEDSAMEEIAILEEELSDNTAPTIAESLLQPPDSPALLPTATTEDEDDGLNLLGSLERELDRQEEVSRAGSATSGAGTNGAAAAAVDSEKATDDVVDNKENVTASEEKSGSGTEETAVEEKDTSTKADEGGTAATTGATADAAALSPPPATSAGEGEEKPKETAGDTPTENQKGAEAEDQENKEQGPAATAPGADGDSVPKESEPEPAQEVVEPPNQE